MKLLLDTHVWIRWLSADQPLESRITELIEDADCLAVSAISCWEVAYLTKRNRLVLPLGLTEWLHEALAGSSVDVVNLTPEIAIYAASLPDIHRDPADHFIMATALTQGFRLLSFDDSFRHYTELRQSLIS